MCHRGFVLVAALLAGAVVIPGTAGVAAQQAPRPTEPEAYAAYLERDERAGRLQVDKVIETLALQPGQRVADIGSGSGLFTRPLAHQVGPDGVVYAIDVDEGLLRVVERTTAADGLRNVRIVKASATDPGVPEPVDLIFICDTLHHLPQPQENYLRGLRRYLKPGGRVAVIDFARNWPAGHEALQFTPTDVDLWMAAAGFTRAASYDFITDNFFFIYK
jgi:ubiquinone/menaquinone biosynthesis C-methylase UbiE